MNLDKVLSEYSGENFLAINEEELSEFSEIRSHKNLVGGYVVRIPTLFYLDNSLKFLEEYSPKRDFDYGLNKTSRKYFDMFTPNDTFGKVYYFESGANHPWRVGEVIFGVKIKDKSTGNLIDKENTIKFPNIDDINYLSELLPEIEFVPVKI